MATLLPPYIDKGCKSNAEKHLFNVFKNSEFTKDWIVLHSLNLSEHTKRLYGEIDFLLLIPKGGIFVLEVKGGDVKLKNGIWHYTNRYNKTNTSPVGPFNQARDAMFSLQKALKKKFGKGSRISKIMTGFFCAFPDIPFDIDSVEYESWQVLDRDVKNFKTFFEDLILNFKTKHENEEWFDDEISMPSLDDLFLVRDFLRGDFERVRTIKERLEEFDKHVKSYTAEQYRVLDHIALNTQNLTQGSAGTGKTMIAMESAIRSASEGKKVFLTCYNRFIGDWMSKQLEEYRDSITVSSLHSFLFEQSRGFDYDHSQIDKEDFYTKYLPILLRDIFKKGISSKFDVLIIDEGQDLIRTEYLEMFDAMLKDGLSKGRWEIYGDFERQAIFAQLDKEAMFSLLEAYSRFSSFFLRINCRNTKQIGEETSLISGFEKPPFLLEHLEGIPVEYSFYNSSNHQAELLSKYIVGLSSNKLPSNELVIISARKFENSCVKLVSGLSVKEAKIFSNFNDAQSHYNFATIQSYKGMECNYVVVTDIEDLTSESVRALMYVGMSRARYGLTMFISETMRSTYRNILKSKLN